jgi:hypothetical protein
MSAATDKNVRMSYRVGRGEQGVLTFEPYKSAILPLWRFRTLDLARKSSHDLWERFEKYDRDGDFVGMDMTRKFIQMVIAFLFSTSISKPETVAWSLELMEI